MEVAHAVRHADGDAAGQGHVAFAGQQALAGQVDGDQRGRAGRLHGEARPAEVQLVGDSRGQVVLVVADALHAAGGADQAAVEVEGARGGSCSSARRRRRRRRPAAAAIRPRSRARSNVSQASSSRIRCCGSIISASRRAILKKAASNWSMSSSTGAALTKSGRASSSGSTPGEQQLLVGEPRDRLDPAASGSTRSARWSGAPGKRPAMPMIAIEWARRRRAGLRPSWRLLPPGLLPQILWLSSPPLPRRVGRLDRLVGRRALPLRAEASSSAKHFA